MTRQVKSFGRELRIIVPGTWANVPVDDPGRAADFVKKLVKKQVGTADRLARVRREATQELLGTAREAAQIGVHTYLICLELLPEVPFPAALMMVDEDWSDGVGDLLARGDVDGALRAAYPQGEVATQRNGPVARVVEMSEGTIGEGEDATEMQTMRLEYHMPYPDKSKLLFVRVSVPNIPSAEPFAMLFDEIVDSITFLSGDGVPEEEDELTAAVAAPSAASTHEG
ncbi:hypothetical protein [Promicromonospora sp. NPDC023987]|uniref:hypothetical protein n=1 Tax=Promicromonospora sp. NPDC023987 TaxID=3155360 RepID=UPI0033E65AB8